ncbi:MAG: FtsW/RodA/SpoVE family cell cycle protein [Lachnospirales bacterium]
MFSFLYFSIKYTALERGKIKGSNKNIQYVQYLIVIFNFLTALAVLYFSEKYENVILDFSIFILGFIIIKVLFPLFYRGSCPLLLNSILFLNSISLIFIYRLDPSLSIQLFKYILLGFAIILFLPSCFKLVPKIEKLNILYFIGSFVILLLPTIFNNSSAYGANNWVEIGSITFQPSEIVKFTFVFYLASILDKKFTFKRLVYVTGASGILIIVLAMQNDFGGALIFFMTFMTLLFVRTGSFGLFFTGIGGVSLLSVVAYNLASHIQLRVAIWQDPWSVPYTSGYQIVQSLLAIGSYSPFGSGLTNGYPQNIPIIESDFIFSGICEEFGALYGLVMLFIYIIIFYRCINIALRSEKTFHSFLVVGFTSMLAFQTFVIIGGVTKLIPLTGVTLPFVSYGGTSMVSALLMLGIIELICTYNLKQPKKKSLVHKKWNDDIDIDELEENDFEIYEDEYEEEFYYDDEEGEEYFEDDYANNEVKKLFYKIEDEDVDQEKIKLLYKSIIEGEDDGQK